jgi:hypothetical protein
MRLVAVAVIASLSAIVNGSPADLASEDMSFRMGLFPRELGTNLQTFTGALGGIKASAITQSNDVTRQFEVDGDTFVRFSPLPCPAHPPMCGVACTSELTLVVLRPTSTVPVEDLAITSITPALRLPTPRRTA